MSESEEEKKLRKKLAQAEAHRRWRNSPKYAEYKARQKARKEAKVNESNP